MACGDRGLQLIGPDAAFAQGVVEQRGGLVDLIALPAATILVLERNEVAFAVDARVAPGVLQEHQSEEAGCFGLVRHELHEGSAQTNRVLA